MLLFLNLKIKYKMIGFFIQKITIDEKLEILIFQFQLNIGVNYKNHSHKKVKEIKNIFINLFYNYYRIMKNELLKKHTEDLNNKSLKLQKYTDRLNLAANYNHGSDDEKKHIQWLKASVSKLAKEILDLSNHII